MKKLIAVLAVAGFISPAYAEGVFAGVDVGTGKGDTPATFNTATMSGSKTIAGIFAGYDFSENLAVEAKYTGAGEITATYAGGTLARVKGDAFALNVVGTLPLSEDFDLYGKLGWANTRTSISANTTTKTLNGTSRNGVTYGLGAQYNVSKSVGIRLAYDVYPASVQDVTAGSTTPGDNKFNYSVWTIGAKFSF